MIKTKQKTTHTTHVKNNNWNPKWKRHLLCCQGYAGPPFHHSCLWACPATATRQKMQLLTTLLASSQVTFNFSALCHFQLKETMKPLPHPQQLSCWSLLNQPLMAGCTLKLVKVNFNPIHCLDQVSYTECTHESHVPKFHTCPAQFKINGIISKSLGKLLTWDNHYTTLVSLCPG